MNKKSRPISPHLQIYKWSVASTTSIMHRFTGIAVYLATIIICLGVIYTGNYAKPNSNEPQCNCLLMEFWHYAMKIVIFTLLFSLCYHLINGVKHIFWDFFKIGFDKKIAKRNGIFVVAISLVIAVILFLLFFNL